MKLQQTLIQAIVIGVSVGTAATSCQYNEVKSGFSSTKKNERVPKKMTPPETDTVPAHSLDPCLTCGMG